MTLASTRTWFAACLLAGASLSITDPARACSCVQPAPETAFARASAVFAGTVTDIDKPFWDRVGFTSSGLWRVHFTVTQRWRGAADSTVTVRTRVTGESCGYAFRVGQSYLVYVVAGAEPVTGICTGTKDLAHADADRRALDTLIAKSK